MTADEMDVEVLRTGVQYTVGKAPWSYHATQEDAERERVDSGRVRLGVYRWTVKPAPGVRMLITDPVRVS